MGDGALSAMFLSGLTPRRVAIAHRDTPLWKAYLIHWLCLIIGTLVLLVLLVLDKNAGFLVRDLRSFVQHLSFTLMSAAVCAIIVLVIEAGFGLSALMLLPWGDAKAPVRPLWRQALRTVWLHTGHLVLGGAVYGSLQVLCDNLLRPEWWYPYTLVNSPQSRATLTLLRWLYDNHVYLLVIAFAAIAIWCLWALLRAMTTPLLPAETSRPPLCEACGYNLSHHDISARCPECGRPVVQSLGDGLRSIVPWGSYGSKARRTGFWRVTLDAWFDPERFFMGLSVADGLGSAGRFLGNHLLLAVVGLVAGFSAPFALLYHHEFARDRGQMLFIMGCAGAVVAFLFAVLACLVAAVTGLVLSNRDRRNCLGGCLRVACFCAGIFPLWAVSTMASLVVAMKIVESLRAPWGFQTYVMLGFLGLHAIYLVVYVGGVARRMRYVRYANS